MPKMTVKYKRAVDIANALNIDASRRDQPSLYAQLNEAGYFWDSDGQIWQQVTEPADPPTELIRVRVWAETSRVADAATDIVSSMELDGYRLLDQSDAYQCRPPKQLESRIYLSFIINLQQPS